MHRTLRRILTLALTGIALTSVATVVAAGGEAAPAAPPDQAAPAAPEAPAAATGPFYTETQATRGEMQYRAHCAACHGAELEGVNAPGLAGADLYGAWSTLYDVYEYVSIAMPPSNPGGLGIDAYTEIMVHILAFNGYPVGAEPLPADPEFFKLIVLEPQD